MSPALSSVDMGGGRNPGGLLLAGKTGGGDSRAAAVDCRSFKENAETSGTLQSKSTGGHSLNFQNPIRNGCAIRRLTPGEAERLMALPASWTAFGHDGKPLSDSRRYSLCGNSIVVTCLAYIMAGVADQMAMERDVKGDGRQ
jgi:site-specific DNA-cytosine methylase